MRLLNIGCGNRFHAAWVNIDLVSRSGDVIQHDLMRGLPFDDNSFDGVYHSHVLEHLEPEQGSALLREGQRVLKPGGVLRVVVPDLEGIVREYLRALDRANAGEPQAQDDHHWMTIELLDQMVRSRSGGRMADCFRQAATADHSLVKQRMGGEVFGPAAVAVKHRNLKASVFKRWRRLRQKVANVAVAVLVGRQGSRAFREGTFRHSGEIHRWMYDRVSLSNLLSEVGFEAIQSCAADESGIQGFAGFQLDTVDGRIRKPDSLFMEGSKPAAAKQRLAA